MVLSGVEWWRELKSWKVALLGYLCCLDVCVMIPKQEAGEQSQPNIPSIHPSRHGLDGVLEHSGVPV